MAWIDDTTWHDDRGTGTLADACAAFFGSAPDGPDHIAAWRRLLDVAGMPRSDRTVLRWPLTELRREHRRRGGCVHPRNDAWP
jgi:hypothetical protein